MASHYESHCKHTLVTSFVKVHINDFSPFLCLCWTLSGRSHHVLFLFRPSIPFGISLLMCAFPLRTGMLPLTWLYSRVSAVCAQWVSSYSNKTTSFPSKTMFEPGVLVHTCNPKYMGDRNGRITVWGHNQTKKLARLCLKNKLGARTSVSHLWS
jgi:hypothetical protein